MTMIRVYQLAQFIILGMLIFVFFLVGPVIERTLLPVITKFEIAAVEQPFRNDGAARISGVLVKARGHCTPVPGSLVAYTDQYVSTEEYPVKQIRIDLSEADIWDTRPAGSQYFGPWILIPPGPPLGPSVIIRIKHRCHPFWETETTLHTGLTSDFFRNIQIIDTEKLDGARKL